MRSVSSSIELKTDAWHRARPGKRRSVLSGKDSFQECYVSRLRQGSQLSRGHGGEVTHAAQEMAGNYMCVCVYAAGVSIHQAYNIENLK